MALLSSLLLGGAIAGSTVAGAIGGAQNRRQQEQNSEIERQRFLEDRSHAEMREDTAMSRRFAEAEQLGIHPHTVAGGGSQGFIQHGSAGADGNAWQDMAQQLASIAQMGLMVNLANTTRTVRRV